MNCYNQPINKFDLIVAEDTEFDLTRNRVYVVKGFAGNNLIQVKNDEDVIEVYTTECFRFYNNECVDSYWHKR